MSKESENAGKVDVDVAILGGGPGGYTAAFRAADLGLSVCLIEERETLGGTCLNVGCIPSKTLLHAAAVIEEAEEAKAWGVDFSSPKLNIDQLRAKKEEVVAKLTGGLATLAKKRGVTLLHGKGEIKDANTIVAGESEIAFKNLILATGSRPFRIPGFPEDKRIWDSTDALSLTEIPKKLLIIGGGIIGLEMAQVYYALGTEITIVEMMSQIVPPADKDMVNPLATKYKKRYTIYTDTKVLGLRVKESSIEAAFEGKKAPESEEFDAVLVAVGRRPNSEGLEALGIEINDRGFVQVDEKQQTTVPHIYAIGDLIGNPMLAHKATHEGKVAAENIGGLDSRFSPKTIPSVAYTSPEIAWAGLTEKEAKEKGIAVERTKFLWGASGRALSMGAESGTSKSLFDPESGTLLGAAICGANAGELIHEAVLAIEHGLTAKEIDETVHAHPTLSEVFAFTAEIMDGTATDVLPKKKTKRF